MEKRLTNIKKSSFGVRYYITPEETFKWAKSDERSLGRDLFMECLFCLTGIDGDAHDFWMAPNSESVIRIHYMLYNGEEYIKEFDIYTLLEESKDDVIDYVIERRNMN